VLFRKAEKLLPESMQKLPKGEVSRVFGTRSVGGAVGRMTPIVGWGVTALELLAGTPLGEGSDYSSRERNKTKRTKPDEHSR
jgi:hypothetical protein